MGHCQKGDIRGCSLPNNSTTKRSLKIYSSFLSKSLSRQQSETIQQTHIHRRHTYSYHAGTHRDITIPITTAAAVATTTAINKW